MSRLGLAVAVAANVALVASAAPAATVFTANESENSISVIDTVSGQASKIPLSFAPHNVDLTFDHRTLLVTGMAAVDMKHAAAPMAAQDMGRLLLINVAASEPAVLAEHTVGSHPAHVVAASDNRTIFVADSAANQILVFDLVEKRVADRIPTGRYPHGIRLSPDGSTLAVANLKGLSVSLIDVKTRTERVRPEIGAGPIQVAFTPAGDRLLVSLNGENAAVLVDVATGEKIRTFSVGRGPAQAFVTPDGRLGLIANQGTQSRPDDRISIVDLQGSKPVRHLKLKAGPHGVFVSSDGKEAYVTNAYDNSLSVIDLVTFTVSRTIATGKGPNGVVAR